MRILVLQHLDVEHPGVFRDFWAQAGDQTITVDLDQGDSIPNLSDFDLLVVMGGPMDVWEHDLHPWLVAEKAAIRSWVVDHGKPYLGICLGHQLLATALGGTVALMAHPEVGLVDIALTPAGRTDPLLAGFGANVTTFEWHGAEITRLPDGAVILASNAACAVQAFRWGAHAYGFQYHCEITETTVDEWAQIPAYAASLAAALGSAAAAALPQTVAVKLPAFRSNAERLNSNLSEIVAAARAGHVR